MDKEMGGAKLVLMALSPINNQALGIPGGCAIFGGVPCQMETPVMLM